MTQIQRAIWASIVGFFLYTVGDGVRKIALNDFEPIEVQIWAALGAVVSMLAAAPWLGGYKSLFKISNTKVYILKSVYSTLIMLAAVFALSMLSLDIFYTIIFSTPFVTAILAAVMFKESLSAYKLLLILCAFLGVVIAMRPWGTEANIMGTCITLFLSVFFALNSLINKEVSTEEPRFPLGFYPYLLAFIVFLALNGFSMPNSNSYAIVGLSLLGGIFSVIASLIHIYAFQRARADAVAPYQYTQLIWGMVLGYVLFGDIPSPWVLLGAAIIMVAGFLMYKRDNQK